MGHEMFDFDAELGDAVFDYCRDRLSMDPVPLDFGGLSPIPKEAMDGLIRPEGRPSEEIFDLFKNTLAPAVVSIDSPGFLAFIPNAPTKNSLLFDMVVACSGLNGTSWLESSGVVVAENQALAFLADVAGLPESAGGAFVSGGSLGNLSSLTVGRDVGRTKRPELDPRSVRFAISGGRALERGQGPARARTSSHSSWRRTTTASPARRSRRRSRTTRHPENVIGVVATAGTTNAGIVDDLEGLGTYARETRPLVPRRRRLRRGRAALADAPAPAFGRAPRRQLHRRSPQVALRAARLLRPALSSTRRPPARCSPSRRATSTSCTRATTSTTSGIPRTSRSTSRGAHEACRSGSRSSTNGSAAYESAVQCAIDLAQRTQEAHR